MTNAIVFPAVGGEVWALILQDAHSTNGYRVAAAAAPVRPRVEVPEVRVVGVDRAERARPIEAVRTRFERPTPAAARGGQEDGVAVQTGH